MRLRDLTLELGKSPTTVQELTPVESSNAPDKFSTLLVSRCRSVLFKIQIVMHLQKETQKETSGTQFQLKSSNGSESYYEISVACLDARGAWPKSSTIENFLDPGIYYPHLKSHHIYAVSPDQLVIGSVSLNIPPGDKTLAIHTSGGKAAIYHKALECFKRQAQPLRVPINLPMMPTLHENRPFPAYTIFGNGGVSFASLDDSISLDDPTSEYHGFFHAIGAESGQRYKHIFQFSKPLEIRNADAEAGEARRFEVFLCLYDEERDKISWMMQTITGGDISSGNAVIPQISWALHPRLPLLAWLIPGHGLNISHIESQGPPIRLTGMISFFQIVRTSAELIYRSFDH